MKSFQNIPFAFLVLASVSLCRSLDCKQNAGLHARQVVPASGLNSENPAPPVIPSKITSNPNNSTDLKHKPSGIKKSPSGKNDKKEDPVTRFGEIPPVTTNGTPSGKNPNPTDDSLEKPSSKGEKKGGNNDKEEDPVKKLEEHIKKMKSELKHSKNKLAKAEAKLKALKNGNGQGSSSHDNHTKSKKHDGSKGDKDKTNPAVGANNNGLTPPVNPNQTTIKPDPPTPNNTGSGSPPEALKPTGLSGSPPEAPKKTTELSSSPPEALNNPGLSGSPPKTIASASPSPV